MTRVLISNRLQRDFSMVPNALWRVDLPFAAKAVACYLLSIRDGAMPYVAEMEAALGLGRDARRKAFAALEAAGFLSWRVVRDDRRRIVSKTLVLDPLCFDEMEARGRAPEIQAHGDMGYEALHAPEKPAGGESTSAAVDMRPGVVAGSGDTLRDKRIKSAADARALASRRVAPDALAALGSYQAACLRAGNSVFVGGAVLRPGCEQYETLRQAVRSQDAMNGASSMAPVAQ